MNYTFEFTKVCKKAVPWQTPSNMYTQNMYWFSIGTPIRLFDHTSHIIFSQLRITRTQFRV